MQENSDPSAQAITRPMFIAPEVFLQLLRLRAELDEGGWS